MSNYTPSAGQLIGVHQTKKQSRKKQAASQINIVDKKSGLLLDTLSTNGVNKFWGATHIIELEDNVETFNFFTPSNARATPHLSNRNRCFIQDEDGFFREFIIRTALQDRNEREVYTVGSFIELQRGKPIQPGVYTGATLNTLIDVALFGSRWTRGYVDYAGTTEYEIEEIMTPYQLLQKLAKDFGRQLRFHIEVDDGNNVVARKVDAIQPTEEWSGRELTSGRDLLDAKWEETTIDVVTALVGVGPEREDGSRIIVEVTDEDARQVWGEDGEHLWDIHEIDSYDAEMTEAEVIQYTKTELKKRVAAKVQYTVEGADLEYILGYSHEKVRIGDKIRIKATEFNPTLYLDARVIRVETDIMDRSKKTYTLGEYVRRTEADINKIKKELKDQIQKKIDEGKLVEYTFDKETIQNIANTAESNAITHANTQDQAVYEDSTYYTDQQKQNLKSDIENGLLTIPGGSLEGFIEMANTTLKNASSTVYTDEEGNFYFIDPNDMDIVVKITSQGIGVSTNGINGPFENAITGQGINATAIVTGFMSFERARGGYLQIGGDENDLGRLIVYGSNGTPIVDIDNERAAFQNVSAENFSSPVVPKLNTESYILRVDPLNGDDRGTGRGAWDTTGEESPLKSPAEALRRLPDVNHGEIRIQTHYYNSLNVDVGIMELKGVSGSGKIILDGQRTATTLNGFLRVIGTTNEVIGENFTLNSTEYAAVDWRRSFGKLRNVKIYGNDISTIGVEASQGFLDLEGVELYDINHATVRANNASVYMSQCKGLAGDYGVFAQRGGKIGVYGSKPGGGISDVKEEYGGRVDGEESAPTDLGSATPPTPPKTTDTFYSKDAGTWNVDLNIWDDDYYGRTPTQGEWRGAGPYSGFLLFGSELTNTVSGRSITKILLSFTRQGGGGLSRAIDIVIRWHGYANRPSTPSDENLSSDYVTVSLPAGDGAVVELPASFRSAFESGAAKGIGFYTTSTADSSYARIQKSASLKITHQ
ncbi:phage tail spike protein [Halobacillus sp. BBL2006]|uniref:phage tail spike protein n=1 Tax=Halobacillus sp. BBL2006 TaxID=1543706 RepID=UPI0005439AF5|nr:phage tail spike protein [Halobacillus sp. BBL2006]KHE73144.1 hypothetical protein LD39_00695 [Halobacillus sp. BBL2006]